MSYVFLAPSMVSEGYAAAAIGLIADFDDFTILHATESVEKLFGYQVTGELAGQSVQILVPDALRTKHIEHLSGFRADPSARPMGGDRNLSGRRRDGSVFPVEVALYPMMLGGKRCVVVTFFDMSHRRAAQ